MIRASDAWYLRRLLVKRWWLILAGLVLCGGAALTYASVQPKTYQASATAFVYPVHPKDKSAPSASSGVSVLAYTTFAETFNTFAESRALLAQAASGLSPTPSNLNRYRVTSTSLPGSTVIQISVQGPNSGAVAALANGISKRLASVALNYYPAYGVSALDRAVPPRTPIRPRPIADTFYGSLAGLILGIVLAALSIGAWKPDSELAADESIPARRRMESAGQ